MCGRHLLSLILTLFPFFFGVCFLSLIDLLRSNTQKERKNANATDGEQNKLLSICCPQSTLRRCRLTQTTIPVHVDAAAVLRARSNRRLTPHLAVTSLIPFSPSHRRLLSLSPLSLPSSSSCAHAVLVGLNSIEICVLFKVSDLFLFFFFFFEAHSDRDKKRSVSLSISSLAS